MAAASVVIGVSGGVPVPSASAESNAGPGTTVVSEQEFFGYVKRGESAEFDVSVATPALNGSRKVAYTIRLQGMGGVDRRCRIAAGARRGTSCRIGPVRSRAATGLWRASIHANVPDIDGGGESGRFPALNWKYIVRTASGHKTSGRVYAPKRYSIYNRGGRRADVGAGRVTVPVWYLDDRGWLYKATYRGYNGIYSRLTASSLGITKARTGLPVYRSTAINKGSWRVDDPKSQPFRIFWAKPAADLPPTSPSWDGRTRVVNRSRAPLAPAITAMAFTPTSTRRHAGTWSWTTKDYAGVVTLIIDTDLSGSITAADKRVRVVTNGGTSSYAWNGEDDAGRLVPRGVPVTAWTQIAGTGEIHFINSDVEVRGGITVQRLNGPIADRSRLFWNDSALTRTARNRTMTPLRNGTSGADSATSRGVHGWALAGGDGRDGWGNGRWIQEWMRVPLTASSSAVAPAVGAEQRIDKIAGSAVRDGKAVIVQWRIRGSNVGKSPAVDTVVRDVYPPGVRRGTVRVIGRPDKGSFDPAAGRWSIGTLAPGEQVEISLEARVVAKTGKRIVNSATITSPDDPYVPSPICQVNSSLADDTDQCDQVVWTAPHGPAIRTKVSREVTDTGSRLRDTVWVSGIRRRVRVHWKLVGPVTPRHHQCRGLHWRRARVFDSGSFATAYGPGRYRLRPSRQLRKPGCYSYAVSMPGAAHRPGVVAETALVRTPHHPTIPTGPAGYLKMFIR